MHTFYHTDVDYNTMIMEITEATVFEPESEKKIFVKKTKLQNNLSNTKHFRFIRSMDTTCQIKCDRECSQMGTHPEDNAKLVRAQNKLEDEDSWLRNLEK